MELATIANLDSVEAWRNPHVNGIVVRFPNGYGASIINHSGSYGVELAVIGFHGAGREDWQLLYDTPITNDVIGWLDQSAALANLRRIAALPKYVQRIGRLN